MLKVRDHCILLVTTEELLITNAIFKGMILISLLCIPSTEEKYIPFSKTIKVGEYK